MKLHHATLWASTLLLAPAAAQDPDPAQPPSEPAQEPAGTDDLLQEPVDPSSQAQPPLELALEDALALSARNNLQLQVDQIATDVAGYDARGAWGDFEWVFDGTLSYSDSQTESSSFLQGGAVVDTTQDQLLLALNKPLVWGGSFDISYTTQTTDTTNAFSNVPRFTSDILSVTYVQPLLRGLGKSVRTSLQREAEVAYHRQIEVQRQGRQGLALQVYNAYWELVSAREQLGVADSALALALEQLEQNRRRLDAGVGTEVEVLQSEADVANQIELLLGAQNEVKQRMDDLKMLLFGSTESDLWDMEIVPVTPLPTDEEVTAAGLPTWNEGLLLALEMRSELRQQRYTVDIARIRHKRSLSERLAGLDLTLGASSAANDEDRQDALQKTLEWQFPTWRAALNYNMPIGNKTANFNERAARANVRAELLAYDQLELNILAEVRRAVREVVYQAEAVHAAVESLELAERQLAAEEARFAEGLATNFEVLSFKQDLTVAQSNERRARVEYAKALVQLRNAQGILGEEQP